MSNADYFGSIPNLWTIVHPCSHAGAWEQGTYIYDLNHRWSLKSQVKLKFVLTLIYAELRMEFHRRQQYPLVLMSLIMPGAGLFKQIHAAEIGYVYAEGERIARTIDHALLQSYVADSKGSVVNVVDGTAPVAGVSGQWGD